MRSNGSIFERRSSPSAQLSISSVVRPETRSNSATVLRASRRVAAFWLLIVTEILLVSFTRHSRLVHSQSVGTRLIGTDSHRYIDRMAQLISCDKFVNGSYALHLIVPQGLDVKEPQRMRRLHACFLRCNLCGSQQRIVRSLRMETNEIDPSLQRKIVGPSTSHLFTITCHGTTGANIGLANAAKAHMLRTRGVYSSPESRPG